MATTRIKDITTAASTFSSDDFVAIDGATSGTRKMAKADLISEVSSGVSGTYLEESNNLSDVTSVSDAKGNLEIPDVGSSPDEVSLNGMLGSMAFQSAEGISVGTVEATDKIGIGTNSGSRELTIGDGNGSPNIQLLSSNSGLARIEFGDTDDGDAGELMYDHSNNKLTVNTAGSTAVTIDSSQRVGIGTSSPSEFLHLNATSGGVNSRALSRAHFGGQHANHALVLGFCAKADTANNERMVVTETSGSGATGNPAAIRMKTGSIEFHTANAGTSGAAFSSQRWTINSTGNLVANGTGIDFGSGSTLSDYEEGTFTPTIYYQNPTGLSISYTTQNGYYTKIGNTVTVHAKVVWTVTGTPVNDNIGINSFPFSFQHTDLFLKCADSAGASSVAQAGVSTYYAAALSSSLTSNLADDIGSGSKTIIMSGTYQTSQ